MAVLAMNRGHPIVVSQIREEVSFTKGRI